MTDFTYTTKAIPCSYNGRNFRSLLEGRIAYFFDKMNFNWKYEPIELDGYIPDFVLEYPVESNAYPVNTTLFVDVKPFFNEDYKEKVINKLKASGFISNDSEKFCVSFFSSPSQFTIKEILNSLSDFDNYEDLSDVDKKAIDELARHSIVGLEITQLGTEKGDQGEYNAVFVLPQKGQHNLPYWSEGIWAGSFVSLHGTVNDAVTFGSNTPGLFYFFSEIAKENNQVKQIWSDACNHFQYKFKQTLLKVVA